MFNLEQSIAEWRKQMLAAGIKSPTPLEELESHLRDDIEQRVKMHLNAQQAFEMAAEKIGCAAVLKTEFKKTRGTKLGRWRAMRRMGGIGLFGTVILNLAGRFVFHRASSVYFSNSWWEAWSSSYIIWGFFAIMGSIGCRLQLNKVKEQE